MTLLHAVVLGVIQGATEFLPISSSAHLVIVPKILQWPTPGLAFDVLLHGGTLVAVLIYFRSDLISLAAGAIKEAKARKLGRDGRMILLLLAATVPAAVAGVLFKDFFESLFASPIAAGIFLLATAAFMTAADYFGTNALELDQLKTGTALAVGAAQAVAIAPGISRSGATISAGMLLGLERRAAARFSFLLSIPIIAGSTIIAAKDLSKGGTALVPALAGFVAAAIVGYACIAFLLNYLATHKLRIFAIYCALAGAFTITFFLLKF